MNYVHIVSIFAPYDGRSLSLAYVYSGVEREYELDGHFCYCNAIYSNDFSLNVVNHFAFLWCIFNANNPLIEPFAPQRLMDSNYILYQNARNRLLNVIILAIGRPEGLQSKKYEQGRKTLRKLKAINEKSYRFYVTVAEYIRVRFAH